MKPKRNIFSSWNARQMMFLCGDKSLYQPFFWFLSLFLSKSYFLASFFLWLFGSTAIYILLPQWEASMAQWCEYCHFGQWCHIECNLFDIRSLIKKSDDNPMGGMEIFKDYCPHISDMKWVTCIILRT